MSIYDKIILLVDNDLEFLKKLKSLLETQGFKRVNIAKNCQEAFEFIRDIDDLYIISEFYFKSSTGENLLKKFKKRLNGKMKVIVLSKTPKLSDSFKSLRLGALSFINKNEKDWKTLLNNSLQSWIDYYSEQEKFRKDFKRKIYA